MEPRPEIKAWELERLAREFSVKVEAEKVSASYFSSVRIGWRLPVYAKVVVRVVGGHAEEVKACVGRIFLLYGRPDEVPYAFSGGKRDGRRIIEDLLREFREGKEQL